jgi:L-serine dehydratase
MVDKYDGYDDWVTKIGQAEVNFKYTLDWVSCFALAVNEENASFGRVVTAPRMAQPGHSRSTPVLHYFL